MEAPELHKKNPARKPYVTDVLCNSVVNVKVRYAHALMENRARMDVRYGSRVKVQKD